MDIKKWAGTRLAMTPPGAAAPPPGAPPAVPGAPPGPLGTGAHPPGMYGGMYGPEGAPLFNPAITSADIPPTMAAWAQAGGNAPEHPAGPPPWASDQASFAKATELVKKNWEAYKEPWAVVAYAYDCLSGGGAPALSAGPPMPPGPPKPPGPPAAAPKPPGPPAPPGAPKPPPGV